MKYLKIASRDRKTKKTFIRYQFRSYNPRTQRYEPVPIESLPEYIRKCPSDEVAEQYCKTKSAEENAIKARILKRKEWEDKFQDYKGLIQEFGEHHKVSAPNTWKNDVHNLEIYVLPFFLGKHLSSNIHEWPTHYLEFKNWLKNVKPLKGGRATLAISTQNMVIKALNLFTGFYGEANPTELAIKKCSVYPKEMCRKSSADDVLEDQDVQTIWGALKTIRPRSADLFYVLTKTGMRINEALGVGLGFLNEGEITGKKARRYHELIARYDLKYYGYICLESQPKLRSLRDDSGEVPRKALKSRKIIDPMYFRYIPLFDKVAWNIVVRLANNQLKNFAQRKFGKDKDNYLLFDGLSVSMFYQDLKKAFVMTKLRFRSPHKVGRHSYLTWFYDVTYNDGTLAEIVAGHRDKKTMEVYSHLADQIGREQKQKSSPTKPFKPVD